MDDLIRRSDAIKAVTSSADYVADAVERLERIPAVEPNLILPEHMERGEVYDVGETITVMNHEDYMEMFCKAMMWDEYGEEPKQGEWLSTGADLDGTYYYQCSECGAEVCTDIRGMTYPHCPYCLARMKGADNE